MKLKPFVVANRRVDGFKGIEWEAIENIVTILGPFNKYSKKLQSETVTLSDLYGYWMLLRIKISKKDDELSKQLLIEMNGIYHKTLTENPAVIGAVYLDPRYQRGLGVKKSLAVTFLSDLYEKIIRVETDDDVATAVETNDSGKNNGDGSYDELDEYLNACDLAYGTTPTNDSSAPNEREKITKILNDFNNKELPLTASVLDYWKKHQYTYPELYKLASVIMAIPPTQTTVERIFSALALVLTSHRTRLGDQNLENILLVRLNYDLFVQDKTYGEEEFSREPNVEEE